MSFLQLAVQKLCAGLLLARRLATNIHQQVLHMRLKCIRHFIIARQFTLLYSHIVGLPLSHARTEGGRPGYIRGCSPSEYISF